MCCLVVVWHTATRFVRCLPDITGRRSFGLSGHDQADSVFFLCLTSTSLVGLGNGRVGLENVPVLELRVDGLGKVPVLELRVGAGYRPPPK